MGGSLRGKGAIPLKSDRFWRLDVRDEPGHALSRSRTIG